MQENIKRGYECMIHNNENIQLCECIYTHATNTRQLEVHHNNSRFLNNDHQECMEWQLQNATLNDQQVA